MSKKLWFLCICVLGAGAFAFRELWPPKVEALINEQKTAYQAPPQGQEISPKENKRPSPAEDDLEGMSGLETDSTIPESSGIEVSAVESESPSLDETTSMLGNEGSWERIAQQNKTRLTYLMDQLAKFQLAMERADEYRETLSSLQVEMEALRQTNKDLKTELHQATSSQTVLLNRITAMEEAWDTFQQKGFVPQQNEPLPIQHEDNLTGGLRYPMAPDVAQRFMQSIQTLVPQEIEIRRARVDLKELYKDLEKNLDQRNFLTKFVELAEKGYDVHFMIGVPNPEKRPVWLELFDGNAVTLFHPELDLTAFSNLSERDSLPSIYRSPAFGITYDREGVLQFYELRKP